MNNPKKYGEDFFSEMVTTLFTGYELLRAKENTIKNTINGKEYAYSVKNISRQNNTAVVVM